MMTNFKLQIFKNAWHFLESWFWVIWYGYPARKLIVIGVTGTDGKTTTCHLIYEILKQAGYKVALVSTVAAFIGDEEIDTGFHVTTADARVLQPLLKKIVDRGFTHVVLEVTSHSLDQHRVIGCNFYTGVITNITHEHLDYHGTFEKYKAAKMKLLAMSKHPIYEYQISKLQITNPRLAGKYNKYNLGAAEAVAKLFGVEKYVPLVARSFSGVPGRMEEVPNKLGFRTIVDFAHTPNALESVLSTLSNQLTGDHKLIVVFGCAGLRDHSKRPMMGQIAVKYADKVIITAEDPRTESLEDIYNDIVSHTPSLISLKYHPSSPSYVGGGVPQDGGGIVWGETRQGVVVLGGRQARGEVFREDDRQLAINKAVEMARKGDIVVVTGKGHEKSMCFGKIEYPWSDRKVVEEAISQLTSRWRTPLLNQERGKG
jgi:UDP-N-acetylmuramoyl-L-alanyl-D-glutamate--2,6-diaminopimelate ligase